MNSYNKFNKITPPNNSILLTTSTNLKDGNTPILSQSELTLSNSVSNTVTIDSSEFYVEFVKNEKRKSISRVQNDTGYISSNNIILTNKTTKLNDNDTIKSTVINLPFRIPICITDTPTHIHSWYNGETWTNGNVDIINPTRSKILSALDNPSNMILPSNIPFECTVTSINSEYIIIDSMPITKIIDNKIMNTNNFTIIDGYKSLVSVGKIHMESFSVNNVQFITFTYIVTVNLYTLNITPDYQTTTELHYNAIIDNETNNIYDIYNYNIPVIATYQIPSGKNALSSANNIKLVSVNYPTTKMDSDFTYDLNNVSDVINYNTNAMKHLYNITNDSKINNHPMNRKLINNITYLHPTVFEYSNNYKLSNGGYIDMDGVTHDSTIGDKIIIVEGNWEHNECSGKGCHDASHYKKLNSSNPCTRNDIWNCTTHWQHKPNMILCDEYHNGNCTPESNSSHWSQAPDTTSTIIGDISPILTEKHIYQITDYKYSVTRGTSDKVFKDTLLFTISDGIHIFTVPISHINLTKPGTIFQEAAILSELGSNKVTSLSTLMTSRLFVSYSYFTLDDTAIIARDTFVRTKNTLYPSESKYTTDNMTAVDTAIKTCEFKTTVISTVRTYNTTGELYTEIRTHKNISTLVNITLNNIACSKIFLNSNYNILGIDILTNSLKLYKFALNTASTPWTNAVINIIPSPNGIKLYDPMIHIPIYCEKSNHNYRNYYYTTGNQRYVELPFAYYSKRLEWLTTNYNPSSKIINYSYTPLIMSVQDMQLDNRLINLALLHCEIDKITYIGFESTVLDRDWDYTYYEAAKMSKLSFCCSGIIPIDVDVSLLMLPYVTVLNNKIYHRHNLTLVKQYNNGMLITDISNSVNVLYHTHFDDLTLTATGQSQGDLGNAFQVLCKLSHPSVTSNDYITYDIIMTDTSTSDEKPIYDDSLLNIIYANNTKTEKDCTLKLKDYSNTNRTTNIRVNVSRYLDLNKLYYTTPQVSLISSTRISSTHTLSLPYVTSTDVSKLFSTTYTSSNATIIIDRTQFNDNNSTLHDRPLKCGDVKLASNDNSMIVSTVGKTVTPTFNIDIYHLYKQTLVLTGGMNISNIYPILNSFNINVSADSRTTNIRNITNTISEQKFDVKTGTTNNDKCLTTSNIFTITCDVTLSNKCTYNSNSGTISDSEQPNGMECWIICINKNITDVNKKYINIISKVSLSNNKINSIDLLNSSLFPYYEDLTDYIPSGNESEYFKWQYFKKGSNSNSHNINHSFYPIEPGEWRILLLSRVTHTLRDNSILYGSVAGYNLIDETSTYDMKET